MKPADFAMTFKPSYINVVEPSEPQSQYLLRFDGSLDSQDQENAIELDHQLLLLLMKEIAEKIDPHPQYESLRTLKKIEIYLKRLSEKAS